MNRAESLKTVVYHPELAPELARLMQAEMVPGTVVACTTDAGLSEEVRDADALVATHCNLETVMQGTRLRWIQSLASGVEDWFRPPGPPACPITRMTGVYEPYMAEYVLAHILASTQRLQDLRVAQEARQWVALQTQSVRGKVLGVVGLGHVGALVARNAAALGMRVWGLRKTPTFSEPTGEVERVFSPEARDEFLSGLDYVVVALPHTRETSRFIDSSALEALPTRAVLLNISRGGVIDQSALTRALISGRLAGAVLDTFEVEPLPPEDPLWTLPNVIVTPHMAGAVYASELAPICARNLRAFASGVIPQPAVDMNAGY